MNTDTNGLKEFQAGAFPLVWPARDYPSVFIRVF